MMEKNLKDEIRILQDERDKRIEDLLEGKTATADLVNTRGDKVIQKGQELDREMLQRLRHSDILKLQGEGPATARTSTASSRSWSTRPSARSRC